MRHPAALAALAAAGGVAAWPFVEPLLPTVRTADLAVLPAGQRPLRLLHLSDLHLLRRHRRRAEWVRGLARLEPDLVVSTGDHLAEAAAIPLLASSFGAFGCPGFFVPGNNDYFAPRPVRPWGYLHPGPRRPRGDPLPWSAAVAALLGQGWTDLTHRRATMSVHGAPVTLTGTDDAHLHRDRYELVAGLVDGFGIGVTHTPQRRVLSRFVADGHQLLLAGHTHGGQVRLPGLGALVTNCDLPRVKARGVSNYDGAVLHVSAGLGTSPYAPVRLCCRPEASLLTLLPVG